MEALMQHFQAVGFSKEIYRLSAAPWRASTNRMYDDRWLHFTHWATEQGIDPFGPTAIQIATRPIQFSLFKTHGLSRQTVKGYRSCLASVLSHTGMAVVVQDRIISDMISSMKLERPRLGPMLPEGDLGIALKALRKPPYQPLWEASKASHL